MTLMRAEYKLVHIKHGKSRHRKIIDRALQYIEAYFANLVVRVGLYNVSGELPIGERLSFLSVVDYLGFRNCSGILSVDRSKV